MADVAKPEHPTPADERECARAPFALASAISSRAASDHATEADPHPDVFISYASQDAAIANSVVTALESQGLRCWIAPRDVVPGSQYADGIVRAINASKVLVLVLSGHSVESPHVGKEIERASSKRRPIIALRTDSAALSPAFEYFLSESQWIEIGRSGANLAATKLAEAIRTQIGQPVVARAYAHTDPLPTSRPAIMRLPRWIISGAVTALVLALSYFVVDRFWLSTHVVKQRSVPIAGSPPTTVAVPDKSVAVLPFVDMSEHKDQEYFSDGLSEQLIDMLAKVPTLRVPARTSSFYFKGRSEDIPTIAKRLMVAHVLEGSVRRSGKHLRITAQLVRADNGYHLWSETYDREIDDIFKVQDEIAAAVVKALRVSLLGGPPQLLDTHNSEAYTLYLQARYFVDRGWDKENQQRALALVQQALRLDPGFARAWAELSRRYVDEATDGRRPPSEARALALHAVNKALTLEPNLPVAHIAKARISYSLDWEWAAAEAEVRAARELEPSNSEALMFDSALAEILGRYQESVQLRQQAIALDPLRPSYHLFLGLANLKAGHARDAEASFRKALELDPAGSLLHACIGTALTLQGEHDAALAEIQQEPDSTDQLIALALTYHAMGRKADADVALHKLEALSPRVGIASWVAAIYAFRREPDAALIWLDRAYQAHEPSLLMLRGYPLFNSLESDPRYRAFLRKMNLPE